MKLLSICIPTYEAKGLGTKLLKTNLNSLVNQTFKNFEVIISDHSLDDKVKNLCNEYKNKLEIKYFKNKEGRGSISINTNNAIKNASGKLIKILFLDDFLYKKESLQTIVDNFNLEKDNWLATGCIHFSDRKNFFNPHTPKYDKYIRYGKNTIGAPSVLTIKNENPLLFDKNLNWFMDCDYYKKCYDKFGKPKLLDSLNVVIQVGNHQATNSIITKTIKIKEFLYLIKKYSHIWKRKQKV